MKSGGGSDANIFNGLGLTTLNLGVGMENVHSWEKVKIANLELMVLLVLKILTKRIVEDERANAAGKKY